MEWIDVMFFEKEVEVVWENKKVLIRLHSKPDTIVYIYVDNVGFGRFLYCGENYWIVSTVASEERTKKAREWLEDNQDSLLAIAKLCC